MWLLAWPRKFCSAHYPSRFSRVGLRCLFSQRGEKLNSVLAALRPASVPRIHGYENPTNGTLVISEGPLPILLELVNNVVCQLAIPTGGLLCGPDQFLELKPRSVLKEIPRTVLGSHSPNSLKTFLGVLGGESYFASRSTAFTGKSQCASRISNRRCSSR